MEAPKPVPVFRGRVDEKGILSAREVGRFAGYLARLRGKDIEIIIRPERRHRSMNANRFYWGVVIAAGSEWSGYDPEEFHAAMKFLFLPRVHMTLPTGEEVERPGSTAQLGTEAFAEYVNRVVVWLSQQGCPVPNAGEVA